MYLKKNIISISFTIILTRAGFLELYAFRSCCFMFEFIFIFIFAPSSKTWNFFVRSCIFVVYCQEYETLVVMHYFPMVLRRINNHVSPEFLKYTTHFHTVYKSVTVYRRKSSRTTVFKLFFSTIYKMGVAGKRSCFQTSLFVRINLLNDSTRLGRIV